MACGEKGAVALPSLWEAAEVPEALPRPPPLLLRRPDSVGCALCEGSNEALPLCEGGGVALAQREAAALPLRREDADALPLPVSGADGERLAAGEALSMVRDADAVMEADGVLRDDAEGLGVALPDAVCVSL